MRHSTSNARSNSGSSTSRTDGIRRLINLLRVRELQIVLADLSLARSGRKQELIDRIVHALVQFELKAAENAGNHAAAVYYNDQLNAGIRSVEAQVRATRPHFRGTALPGSTTSAAPHASSGAGGGGAARYGYPIGMGHVPGAHHGGGGGRAPPHGYGGAVAPSRGYPPGSMHMPSGDGGLGVEPLTATLVNALDGARCFCNPNAHISGRVVACVACRRCVHAKCHQLSTTAPTDDWYCELCRANEFDPFLVVSKTILPPAFVRFHKSLAPFRIEYVITDHELNDLHARRDPKSIGSGANGGNSGGTATSSAMTPGCRELQLRCFTMKESLATGTSWPTSSHVTVNGFSAPLTQRAPPGQSNPSKVLRELPTNVFSYTRVGRNVIEVRPNVDNSQTPLVYAFMVQVVEFRDVNDLVEEVKAASASITYEDAKTNVINSFRGDFDDDDDDDGVVATCTMLSVRCPLGLCVISLPARGLHCKHLQCFDLRTFLLFNRKARSRAYRCTVCHNFIKASDLRIDPWLKKLLEEVEGDEDLEEVEISPDASWKRRKSDDSVEEPPMKRVKTEVVEEVTSAAATAAGSSEAGNGSASPPATGGSASAPFEIDLLSSDDEDEDVAPNETVPTRSTAPTTAPLPPRAVDSSSSSISDDDVAILTVDSDIWETMSSGNNHGSTQVLAGMNGTGNTIDPLLPFPMDDSLFGSYAGTDRNPVDLSSNAAWNAVYASMPLPSMPSVSMGNTYGNPIAWTPDIPTSSMPLPSVRSMTASTNAPQNSDASLASAMTMLSRNHPSGTSNSMVNRQRLPKPPTQQEVMDVICLLDSDSE